jgi:hypothetical protein
MSKKSQISFPLDIPNVRVLKTEMNKRGDYIITVESTKYDTNYPLTWSWSLDYLMSFIDFRTCGMDSDSPQSL